MGMQCYDYKIYSRERGRYVLMGACRVGRHAFALASFIGRTNCLFTHVKYGGKTIARFNRTGGRIV